MGCEYLVLWSLNSWFEADTKCTQLNITQHNTCRMVTLSRNEMLGIKSNQLNFKKCSLMWREERDERGLEYFVCCPFPFPQPQPNPSTAGKRNWTDFWFLCIRRKRKSKTRFRLRCFFKLSWVGFFDPGSRFRDRTLDQELATLVPKYRKRDIFTVYRKSFPAHRLPLFASTSWHLISTRAGDC